MLIRTRFQIRLFHLTDNVVSFLNFQQAFCFFPLVIFYASFMPYNLWVIYGHTIFYILYLADCILVAKLNLFIPHLDEFRSVSWSGWSTTGGGTGQASTLYRLGCLLNKYLFFSFSRAGFHLFFFGPGDCTQDLEVGMVPLS